MHEGHDWGEIKCGGWNSRRAADGSRREGRLEVKQCGVPAVCALADTLTQSADACASVCSCTKMTIYTLTFEFSHLQLRSASVKTQLLLLLWHNSTDEWHINVFICFYSTSIVLVVYFFLDKDQLRTTARVQASSSRLERSPANAPEGGMSYIPSKWRWVNVSSGKTHESVSFERPFSSLPSLRAAVKNTSSGSVLSLIFGLFKHLQPHTPYLFKPSTLFFCATLGCYTPFTCSVSVLTF